MQGIDSDLIRGHIDTIILKVLFEGDRYGYEICKEVEEKSNGAYELKQPTLYSCLKRLESQGLISSYWEESDIGGKRHYYKLTEEGRKTFQENYDEWTRSRQIIDNLISNPFVKASSYALVNKEEYEELEKKANLAEGAEVEKTESEPEVKEKIVEKIVEVPVEKIVEKIVEVPVKEHSYVEGLVPSVSVFDDDQTIPWQEVSQPSPAPREDASIYNEENAHVTVTANGEPVEAFALANDEEGLEEDEAREAQDELPFAEEIDKAQASIFEEDYQAEAEPESQPQDQRDDLIEHFDEPEIEQSQEAQIEHFAEPEVTFEEPKLIEQRPKVEFVLDDEDAADWSASSYFESEDPQAEKEPAPVLPPIAPPAIEEPEEIVERQEEPLTHIYHDFGADKYIVKEPLEQEELDKDAIYQSPLDDEEDDSQALQESFFSSDIMGDAPSEEPAPEYEEVKAGNTTFMDFYKPTEKYGSITAQYTEQEYKDKLNSLTSIANMEPDEQKPAPAAKPAKDFIELKNAFEQEGLTVKPYQKFIKESRETRSFVEANKINLVTSWTVFGFITFLLSLTYIIMNNYRDRLAATGFSWSWFLIGIGVTAIVPIIYTIIFIVNPYKKKAARYNFAIYMLFAVLLTIQLCIITYCVNLQIGFYSFTQPTYNHLLWIIPLIISFYPILDAVLHNIYFKSKNFHV